MTLLINVMNMESLMVIKEVVEISLFYLEIYHIVDVMHEKKKKKKKKKKERKKFFFF